MSENRLLNVLKNVNIENVGDEIKLELTEKNKNEEISYEIKDEDIVKVDDEGNLVGVKEGSTKVIVTNKDQTKKQTITVNVGKDAIQNSSKKDTSNSNSNKNNNSKNDENKNNSSTNNTTNDTSSNTNNNNNTSNSKKDNNTSSNTKPSTNTNIKVTGISLNRGNTEIYLNNSNTFTISATVTPNNANKTVYWSSSNSNVASVNNGTVTAKNPGVATITAKTADGNKSASITVTVKKKIVIIIGASQVDRMAKNVSSYKSSRFNYSTSDETLVYIYKNGSGMDWQRGAGYDNAYNIIKKYLNNKNYTYFHIFFPLVGNTIKTITCDEISTSNVEINGYAKDYNNIIQNLKNIGFNVQGYVVSMHPVQVSKANSTTVVYNDDTNACSKNYRSNYKFYQFNRAMKSIVQNNYSNNLKYESLFIQIMDVKDGSKVRYDFKLKYNTEDGIHWDSATTHTYVNMMLGYTNDL